ncbi:hypothetical protein PAPYR_7584 [Paratrimastix pyriformis]|uniref:Secreted protein n=1 Tax=Paratrimastix pyriformis TaxID=342808 RepID=A0ABQ8UCQ3_9EUKA|nr:hypothetical protein PAPYR_7584 [Paratrimastix pyriformis]
MRRAALLTTSLCQVRAVRATALSALARPTLRPPDARWLLEITRCVVSLVPLALMPAAASDLAALGAGSTTRMRTVPVRGPQTWPDALLMITCFSLIPDLPLASAPPDLPHLVSVSDHPPDRSCHRITLADPRSSP